MNSVMMDMDRIKELITRKIEGTGVFLVDISLRQGNFITVYLDKYEGISIDECAEISRHLNANLDRDTEDYELEVSSPGLSAPFKVKEQYEKYKGRNVEVLLNNGKKLTGKLMAFSDTGIELEVFIRETGNKKGKKNIPQLVKMDLQEIKSTKSVVSFKQ